MALKVEGFEVSVYSRSPNHEEKNRILNAIGVPYIAAETHSTEEMAKMVGPIDVVYEATGASGVAFDVLKHLGPNAVFVFTGVPGRKGPIPVDTDEIMRNMVLNNQLVLGSVNAPPQAFQSAIQHLGVFAQQWPDALRSVITARFPIERALDALKSQPGGVKNVVAIGERDERSEDNHQDERAKTMQWIDISVPLRNGMVTWPGDAKFERTSTLEIAKRRSLQFVADFHHRAHRNSHGCSAPLPGRRRRHGDHADRGVHRTGARDRDPGSRGRSGLRSWNRITWRRASACCSRPGIPAHCWKTDHFQKKYIYIAPETAHYLAERGVQTVGVDYLSVGGFEQRRPGNSPHLARRRASGSSKA